MKLTFPPILLRRLRAQPPPTSSHPSQKSRMFPLLLTTHRPLIHQPLTHLSHQHQPLPHQSQDSRPLVQPLEALEATEGEGAQPMGPPPKPQSKAAAVNKDSQRQRKLLIEAVDATSGDDQHQPKLGNFLLGAKSKAAAKRAASVSAKKRKATRCQSHERSRSHGRIANEITGGPIRPLSPQRKKPQDVISGGSIRPLSPQRKKPQSVLVYAEKVETWKDKKHRFLQETYDSLTRSWTADSMAWTNLHVVPLELLELPAPSPGGSGRWVFPLQELLGNGCQQLYHWWEIHAKQSHWDWVRRSREPSR